MLRHRHPGRLRRALPAGQLALHRLLRAHDGVVDYGARLMTRAGLGDRLQRAGGDRPHHPDGIPDPVGTFYRFSLAEQPAAAQGSNDAVQRQRPSVARQADSHDGMEQ